MRSSAAQIRVVLAHMLVYLSTAMNSWYTINPETSDYDFSRCKRLGMIRSDYEALLVAAVRYYFIDAAY